MSELELLAGGRQGNVEPEYLHLPGSGAGDDRAYGLGSFGHDSQADALPGRGRGDGPSVVADGQRQHRVGEFQSSLDAGGAGVPDDIAHLFLEYPVDLVCDALGHLLPGAGAFEGGIELNTGGGLGAEALGVHFHYLLDIGEIELRGHHVMGDGAHLAPQPFQH